ncbi:MAG: hypothetical protein ACTJLL_03620, partial [Anaplasma sp.]
WRSSGPQQQMSASASEGEKPSTLSMFKAAALAVALIPFRAITLLATAVLIAVDLVHLPFRLAQDFFCSKFGKHSSGRGEGAFPRTAETVESINSYARAAFTDVAWIASIGITGVPSLLHAASVSGVSFSRSGGVDRGGGILLI